MKVEITMEKTIRIAKVFDVTEEQLDDLIRGENPFFDELEEEIEQYHYRDEEEKIGHSKLMKERDFEDSGQVKENIGTVMQPNHVWFGSYYRYKRI